MCSMTESISNKSNVLYSYDEQKRNISIISGKKDQQR
jgi:hypothetical protein